MGRRVDHSASPAIKQSACQWVRSFGSVDSGYDDIFTKRAAATRSTCNVPSTGDAAPATARDGTITPHDHATTSYAASEPRDDATTTASATPADDANLTSYAITAANAFPTTHASSTGNAVSSSFLERAATGSAGYAYPDDGATASGSSLRLHCRRLHRPCAHFMSNRLSSHRLLQRPHPLRTEVLSQHWALLSCQAWAPRTTTPVTAGPAYLCIQTGVEMAFFVHFATFVKRVKGSFARRLESSRACWRKS